MWDVILLFSESRAIINDLDVILHGFMLQIIYTTVFRVIGGINIPTHRIIHFIVGTSNKCKNKAVSAAVLIWCIIVAKY